MLATDSLGRSLAQFLLSRINEDEALARQAYEESAAADPQTADSNSAEVLHTARHSPARVLISCEAKRQIVQNTLDADPDQVTELFALEPQRPSDLPREQTVTEMQFFERVLRYLAVTYADHPDYEMQWRP